MDIETATREDRFQGIRDMEVEDGDVMKSIYKISEKYAALNYKAIKMNDKYQVIAWFRNESRLKAAIQKSEKAEKEDCFK